MSNLSDFVIENGVLKKYVGPGGDVVIPEGVTSIGDRAFYWCSGLTSVTIPDSVTSIGDSAFSGCRSMRSVTLPDSVTSIGDSAFYDCSSLTSVTIPDSVTSIGGGAFSHCSSLTSVTIPDSVRNIGNWTFSWCSSLTSVKIPGSVTSIGNGVFSGCSSLVSVTIPGKLMSIGNSAFSDCSNLTSVTLPESVRSIGDRAFERCESLASVTIPEGVTSIGVGTFTGCSSLMGVHLPKTIQQIGDQAFSSCKCLEEINIPATLSKIGMEAFAGCGSLTATLSAEGLELGSGALKGCGSVHMQIPESIAMTKEALPGELARGSIETTEKGYANLILFQNTPLWRAWRNDTTFSDPGKIFTCMLQIAKEQEPRDKKQGTTMAAFILRNFKTLPKEQITEAIGLYQGMKCKDIDGLKKESALQDYLAGKKEKLRPEEEEARSLLETLGDTENVGRSVSKGLRFRDGEGNCSREYLVALLTVYAREWRRVCSQSYGEMTDVEMLEDGSKVQVSDTADRLAAALDPRELSLFLEKLISGSKYRPFLLSWARFADEQSVEEKTGEYKKKLRGHAAENYYAANLCEALMISPTRAAMRFLDSIDDLDRYAAMRGMSAMEMRDSAMLPELGFDGEGVRCFDIGGNVIEARLTDDLGLALFDRNKGKAVRSFPKKSENPEKAEAAAKDYAELKKQVVDLVKQRSNLLQQMHLSGERLRQEHWRKTYLEHPVIRRLSPLVIWMDEQGQSFLLQDGRMKNAALELVEPEGSICLAHVLELGSEEVKAWQHCLTKLGRKQLFEQIWEPVLPHDLGSDGNRYRGIVITNKERNALKAALKRRGVEVSSGELGREFNASSWGYDFATENTMYFGRTLSLDYSIREESGELVLGKASVEKGAKDRELNAVILELDRITCLARVRKDDVSVMELMDAFTLAQITEFIKTAQEANAVNVLALLLEYKNAHFADFDPMDEFTLEW